MLKVWSQFSSGGPLGPLAICLLAVVGAGSVSAQEAGFRYPLLAGPISSNWIVTGCDVELSDGVLRLVDGDGFVRLPHALRDFELSFSFKPEKESQWDSGLYFRAQLPGDASPWPKRYQINLRQGQEGRLLGVKGGDVPAGLIQEGEWNHFRLRVVGSQASLQVNNQPAWQVDGIEPTSGFVGIQSEVPLGGSFSFKDMTVIELDGRSIFNGDDLTGWTPVGGNDNRSWEVRDGLLMCTGAKGSWLRLNDQQRDFNLRLEYRLKARGNSGVYIRVPEDGNHHGPESGIEVQILDDADPKYKSLKDYQYSGSLYAVVPADPRVSRSAGTWNQLEIDARGQRYQVWHNGQLIIDAASRDYPLLKERRLEGFLGLQNHSEEVGFRRLRLSPSYQVRENSE